MKHYRSSIPKEAQERIVATFVTGPQKYKAEYVLDEAIVGVRYFHENGDLSWEWPLKNGLTHGIAYRSDEPGRLLSAEPFFDGLPHGTARQWSASGKLMGTYVMKHGTGIDLWRSEFCESGGPYLAEARYLKHGKWHGFEWWIDPDQRSVWEERHFWEDQMHGIERSWNRKDRLRRGYPRYWIRNKRVSKRQYVREARRDPTLPSFREADNRPQRTFPPEVSVHLTKSNRVLPATNRTNEQ